MDTLGYTPEEYDPDNPEHHGNWEQEEGERKELEAALVFARAGHAFLKEKLGEEYWHRVSSLSMQMNHPYHCVLAQAVEKTYVDALYIVELKPSHGLPGKHLDLEMSLGFLDSPGVRYPALNRAWKIIMKEENDRASS